MFKVVAEPFKDDTVRLEDMKVGDIGVMVCDNSHFPRGHLVSRFGETVNHWVSLNDPRRTWTCVSPSSTKPRGQVRLLPPGTELKLVVEGGEACSK